MKEALKTEEIVQLYQNYLDTDDKFKPDGWQKELLDYEGSVVARTGRQVGKSTTVGKKAAKYAVKYPGITILMVAAAQRQSSEIFEKTLGNLYEINRRMLEKVGKFKPNPALSSRQNEEARRKYEFRYGIFKEMPTRTEARLNNSTRLLSLPTGKTGAYIRCYTVDVLIADEAAFIPEPVWVAIKPMLAVSKKLRGLGYEILISTPFGKGGYYFQATHDPDFKQFHVSSESCRRIPREFLRKERIRLSKREYAQEYLGEFTDEFNQFFPTALIKGRMTFIGWDKAIEYNKGHKYFLGLDIARYGKDENAFVIARLLLGQVMIVHCFTTEAKALTDTVGRVIKLDQEWHFNKIFTDVGGIGAGVTDMLIEKLGKQRVHGIDNSAKSVESNKMKAIMKEDLYSNALILMEQSKIDIISNLKLQRSLKCMTFEYSGDAKLRIYGNYSHLSEAFVRACWCVKSKHLNLFVA